MDENEDLSLNDFIQRRLKVLDEDQGFQNIGQADSYLFSKWNNGLISKEEWKLLRRALPDFYRDKNRL